MGTPLPVRSDRYQYDSFTADRHERELARIVTRPPVRTSDHAERRAAERAREDAKAEQIAQFKASWAKVRARLAEEAE